jgi:hypothetical protein
LFKRKTLHCRARCKTAGFPGRPPVQRVTAERLYPSVEGTGDGEPLTGEYRLRAPNRIRERKKMPPGNEMGNR